MFPRRHDINVNIQKPTTNIDHVVEHRHDDEVVLMERSGEMDIREHAGPLPRFLDESEKGGVKGFPSDLVETAATAVLNPKPETCAAALRVPCGPGWQASLQKSDSSFATDRRLGRSDAIRERQRQGDRQGSLR